MKQNLDDVAEMIRELEDLIAIAGCWALGPSGFDRIAALTAELRSIGYFDRIAALTDELRAMGNDV